MLFVIVAIVILNLQSDNPVSISPEPIPTVAVNPAPTREPDVPSFESACRTFRSLVRDIETNQLADYDERLRRIEEVRNNARFPGSPASFLEMINTYARGVDEKIGTDSDSPPPIFSEMDIAELDRAIIRARDNMTSECRAREG